MNDDKYMKVYNSAIKRRKYYHSDDSDFESKMKEVLLYRKIISVERMNDQDAVLTLDNGVELYANGNQGCGGCNNGWYYLKELNDCNNAITNVEVYSEGADEVYKLFVFADNKKINVLSYEGEDNGYYGTGYMVSVLFYDEHKRVDRESE